jgi:hypothetical protein
VKLGREVRDVNRKFAIRGLGATPRPSVRNWLRAGTWAGALFWCLTGCGYQPVYGGGDGHGFEVVTGRVATASFEAGPEVAAGVRSELGPAGALGSGFPRVVVEVLRIDERSTGVRTVADGTPLARGAEVVVVGRAYVLDRAEAVPSRDTGDMSRAAQFAAGTTPTADAAARSRAVRDAARELGKALGRAVLGLPEPMEG